MSLKRRNAEYECAGGGWRLSISPCPGGRSRNGSGICLRFVALRRSEVHKLVIVFEKMKGVLVTELWKGEGRAELDELVRRWAVLVIGVGGAVLGSTQPLD